MRFLVLALVAVGACAAPVQNGGVDVQPGAAERLAVTCRWRHGDVGREGCFAPEAQQKARVARIEGQGPLEGALAIGRAGDYVLANDEVVFVIDQLGRGTGFAESGGNVVDAADAHVAADELGQIFTYFGQFPRQALYDHLETGVDAQGVAWITVSGRELYEAKLVVRTRYALTPGARALAITTELENTGASALAPIELGDAIQWGSAEKIAAGKSPGFAGDHQGGLIGAVGRRVAYALAPTSIACEGCAKEPGYAARNGTAWTNASYAKGVVLGPGKRARYERALFVGGRGDGASLDGELFYGLAGGSPGGVTFSLADARGAAAPAGKGRVVIEPEKQTPVDVAPLYFRPAPETSLVHGPVERPPVPPSLGGELPPGRYQARFEGDGRKSAPTRFEVEAGAIAKVRLALDGGARLRVVATENGKPVPAKIQIFDAKGASVVDPQLALRGAAEVGVAPGRYRVVASRGPEYALAEATVDAGEGAPAEVPLALRRVVETPGYIACDLHQHSAWSADSGVTIAERVLSNVVEGVECAVASEHNQVVDFGPVVKELGVEALFRSIPGDEITSDASRAPFGHANVFPLAVDPKDARGGAPAVRDRSAHQVFEAVRALPQKPLIQVNHPRAGNRIGYFEELRFDPARGVGADPGYDAGFDALEVWSGRHVKERDRVLGDFWALLRTGHVVTPTANTDTHGVLKQEAGYPRTYVRVADDDPARLDVASLVDGIRVRRDVVLTNGPMIVVRGEQAHPGALVALEARPRDLTLHVEHAPWVEVTEVLVLVDGVSSEPVPVGRGETTAAGAVAHDVLVRLTRRRGAAGPPRFTRVGGRLSVELGKDAAVAFAAVGHRPLEPVLSGDPAEITPFALTSPLFVDADGDGRWAPN